MSIVIVPATQIPTEVWPDILTQTHSDWFFNRDQLRYTTAGFGPPPLKIDGNAEEFERWYKQVYANVWKPCDPKDIGAQMFKHPKPIPEKGQWWKGDPAFYASTTNFGLFGLYYRSGNRWDDVDGYYELNSFKVSIVK